MATHNDIGKKGEAKAVEFLERLGYNILKTNWYSGNNEVDIIAENKDYIIFAEVKTRSSDYYGTPESFVTKMKQQFLIKAANRYISQYEVDKEVRFDVISVLINHKNVKINHIIDAFYPIL